MSHLQRRTFGSRGCTTPLTLLESHKKHVRCARSELYCSVRTDLPDKRHARGTRKADARAIWRCRGTGGSQCGRHPVHLHTQDTWPDQLLSKRCPGGYPHVHRSRWCYLQTSAPVRRPPIRHNRILRLPPQLLHSNTSHTMASFLGPVSVVPFSIGSQTTQTVLDRDNQME